MSGTGSNKQVGLGGIDRSPVKLGVSLIAHNLQWKSLCFMVHAATRLKNNLLLFNIDQDQTSQTLQIRLLELEQTDYVLVAW